MKKVNRPAALERLRHSILAGTDPDKPCISICKSTGCSAFRADEMVEGFRKELKKKKLENKVDIKTTGCHGFCERGPIIVLRPQGIFYQRCKPEHIPDIVSKTIVNGKLIDELLYVDPATGEKITYEKDVPFYKKQVRVVLANCGTIDPNSIEDYLAVGGYKSLIKALFHMDGDRIVDEVKRSGLRGRGGAGFPTGIKWEETRKQPSDVKYVICNGDEGDPGAYMDRTVLESNPHSVIEGMMIGAYAIGANEGFVYVRNEYQMAVRNIDKAVKDALMLGILGKNILGSNFSFDIRIARGAGAFVCGEETALLASIEGKRGIPRQRPPFPVRRGLFGRPTTINNVETWANIPPIIENGADWFSAIGLNSSHGTKIFSLVGKVQNTGLIEVPKGTPIRDVVYEIGGGPPKNSTIKAIQSGGPSGGCIPTSLFHLPIDFDSLKAVGAIMGSGGIIVMDQSTCMVDIAKYFTNFLKGESCGGCVTCREGTQRMHEILSGITEGAGKKKDLKLLEEMSRVIRDASMCGLGQTAPNPVAATMKYFMDEYIEHIEKKHCRAAVCKEIISSPCQHTCPIDTEAATYISLIAKRRFGEALEIIKKDNPLCSTLARVCDHPCESRCRMGDGGEPISIRGLKRFVTDYGLRNKLALAARPAPKNASGKVAVIGAGPAGLTCAFRLAMNGYETTIFEKLPVAGGMLAVAIPEFRLPREVLNADIEYVKSAGVEVRTNTALGKDITIDGLFRQGYKAVFLATGAHKSLKLGIAGENARGVFPAMEMLRNIHLGNPVALGRRVGIIGGGNSAIDAARVALRVGKAESVTIYYRRTSVEMPAYKEEIVGALKEGIKIEFLTAPTKISTDKGSLAKCHFVRMKLGDTDGRGRRKPVPIPGSEFVRELDTLVVAIGEQPDLSFAHPNAELTISRDGGIKVDPETLATNIKGIFAGGDSVTGPNSVVQAVAAGKVAAASIEQFLNGREVKREYKLTRPSRYIEPVELGEKELAEARRPVRAHLKPEERRYNFREVDLCLTEMQAVDEARRCLRCDLETGDGRRFLEGIKSRRRSGKTGDDKGEGAPCPV